MCFFSWIVSARGIISVRRSGVRTCCTCYAKEVAILYDFRSLRIKTDAKQNRPFMNRKVPNIQFKSSDKAHSFIRFYLHLYLKTTTKTYLKRFKKKWSQKCNSTVGMRTPWTPDYMKQWRQEQVTCLRHKLRLRLPGAELCGSQQPAAAAPRCCVHSSFSTFCLVFMTC